jgi:MerR family redox-sensitive transcriptional activator SoxR
MVRLEVNFKSSKIRRELWSTLNSMPVPLTIGEVARRSGLRASAIRFYEKTGLLPKPDRRGGQRRYDPAILERLAVLEFAKQCGFTLDEARHLFDDFPGDAPLSQRLPEIAAKKIVQLDALAARIAAIKERLAHAQACQCADLQECGRQIRQRAATPPLPPPRT